MPQQISCLAEDADRVLGSLVVEEEISDQSDLPEDWSILSMTSPKMATIPPRSPQSIVKNSRIFMKIVIRIPYILPGRPRSNPFALCRMPEMRPVRDLTSGSASSTESSICFSGPPIGALTALTLISARISPAALSDAAKAVHLQDCCRFPCGEIHLPQWKIPRRSPFRRQFLMRRFGNVSLPVKNFISGGRHALFCHINGFRSPGRFSTSSFFGSKASPRS